MNTASGIAVIAGAGPAGLTAAYELAEKTRVRPVVLEATDRIGGIAKTIDYKGNRIDVGIHRFFSKSDEVMAWWLKFLPLQGAPSRDDLLLGRQPELSSLPGAPNPETDDRVMLRRQRISRILYRRKFFDYPVSLNWRTLAGLGTLSSMNIALGYARARLRPIKPEKNLEDFFINRFGGELYETFFKDYTEKVWGIGCDQIAADWGAQRVKGLSITGVIKHAVRKALSQDNSLAQKDTETSLIERFLYPKYGPGQMWEEVAAQVSKRGGEVRRGQQVVGLKAEGDRIVEVRVRDATSGQISALATDYFFSTMPVKDLIRGFEGEVPDEVRRVSEGLVYRDFIIVGLLLRRILYTNHTRMRTVNDILPDNWIYVQEPDVRLGRIDIFNNWSPYLIADPNTVWVGLEYFCNEGDDLWSLPDEEMGRMAADELARIRFIDRADVLDQMVIRSPKAYPAYFGTYGEMGRIRDFTDRFTNLFLIGRNGMHRYNNMDHSMLAAMTAVDNIVQGRTDKANIWAVNAEEAYHESTA